MNKDKMRELGILLLDFQAELIDCENIKCSECEFYSWKKPEGYCFISRILRHILNGPKETV